MSCKQPKHQGGRNSLALLKVVSTSDSLRGISLSPNESLALAERENKAAIARIASRISLLGVLVRLRGIDVNPAPN
jgi:hypothetical protein